MNSLPQRYVECFNSYWPKASGKIYELLASCIKKWGSSSVCEVGCASGHLLLMLETKGFGESFLKLTGIEIRKEICLNTLKRLAGCGSEIKLINADVLEIDDRFDVIFSTGLLQCLTDEKREEVISHIRDIASKSIFVIPHIDEIRNADSSVEIGVSGCVEYPTQCVKKQLEQYYNSVQSGIWNKEELCLKDDFLYFICEREVVPR